MAERVHIPSGRGYFVRSFTGSTKQMSAKAKELAQKHIRDLTTARADFITITAQDMRSRKKNVNGLKYMAPYLRAAGIEVGIAVWPNKSPTSMDMAVDIARTHRDNIDHIVIDAE